MAPHAPPANCQHRLHRSIVFSCMFEVVVDTIDSEDNIKGCEERLGVVLLFSYTDIFCNLTKPFPL